MTNTELFKKKVDESGITYTFLASKIGITRECLYSKVNNLTEFKASEIAICSDILKLNSECRDKIFFN